MCRTALTNLPPRGHNEASDRNIITALNCKERSELNTCDTLVYRTCGVVEQKGINRKCRQLHSLTYTVARHRMRGKGYETF